MKRSILTRGWAAVCGLVLLAGCTATRTGSASAPSSTSPAGSSDATTAGESGVVLRSAVVLTGSSTTTSTKAAAPSPIPAGSSARVAVSTAAPTPTVTVTRTAVVTSTSATSVGDDETTGATTTAPATYPCPTPAQLGPEGGNLRTAVRCYDGNRWLITSGVYPGGAPVDGIMIVHQTSPGQYTVVGGGSSFSGDDDHLASQGLPADLVSHLADGTPLAHETRFDHTLADFERVWYRHTSQLILRAGGTGVLSLGSGCCNSISLPLSFTPSDYDGLLTARVSGPATYTGTSFSSIKVAVGTLVTFHFEQGDNGPVLMSTSPTGGGGPIVWCGASRDDRCGA